MPRVQAYLPEDLYQQLKESGISASEVLQQALRERLRSAALRDDAEEYYAELVAEFGEPTPQQVAEAEALADRLAGADRRERKAS